MFKSVCLALATATSICAVPYVIWGHFHQKEQIKKNKQELAQLQNTLWILNEKIQKERKENKKSSRDDLKQAIEKLKKAKEKFLFVSNPRIPSKNGKTGPERRQEIKKEAIALFDEAINLLTKEKEN